MSTPSIQTLITQAQQVLNLKSSNEIRATLAAVLANANVGTPLNPNLTTQQLWDEFYEIVRQPSDDIMSIITDQMMRMVFSPPAPGGAGADKQVIFNDGGVLAGDTKFLWDKNANRLDVDGPVAITGAATVGTTLGVTGVSTLASATVTGLATVGTTFAVGTVTPDIFARFYTRSIGFDSSGTTALQINGTSYSGVDLGAAGVRTFGITASGTDANISTITNIPMLFGINNTEAMRLNSTANLVLKGGTANANGVGVTFPATQVASSDANCLDDYEEGTWTIGLEFGGASTGMTKNADTGKYTKIGNQVTVTGYLALTNKGSATGDALITGLPFLINSYGGLSIYLAQITFADFPMGYSNNGTSTIPLRECTNAGVVSSLTDADFANNSEIIFTMTYTVA